MYVTSVFCNWHCVSHIVTTVPMTNNCVSQLCDIRPVMVKVRKKRCKGCGWKLAIKIVRYKARKYARMEGSIVGKEVCRKSIKGQGEKNTSKVAINYSRKWVRNIASNYAREYAGTVVKKQAKNIRKKGSYVLNKNVSKFTSFRRKNIVVS